MILIETILSNGQGDGRWRMISRHTTDDGRPYTFDWRDASEQAAIATRDSRERENSVLALARADEESDFYEYVKANQSTDGFTLHYHTPEARDALLLSRYFSDLDSADANLISDWVRVQTVEHVAQVLALSAADAQTIIDRAVYLKDDLEPAAQVDRLWQATHGRRGQRSGPRGDR